MAFPSDFRQAQPADQADGLRRLFSVRSVRFIPVVSNPFVQHQDQLLHRMMVALESLGLYTLMVDASERAPRARDGLAHHVAEQLGAGVVEHGERGRRPALDPGGVQHRARGGDLGSEAHLAHAGRRGPDVGQRLAGDVGQ